MLENYKCVVASMDQIIEKWDEEIKKHNYSEEWKTLSNLFTPRCEQLGYCPEKYSCGRKKKKNEVLGVQLDIIKK